MKLLPFFLLAAFAANCATAQQTPVNGRVTPAGPATLALGWDDIATDETGYEIERSNGVTWSSLTNLSADSTYFYDRGLTPLTSRTYRVRAVKDATSSAWLTLGTTNTTLRMNIVFILADDMGYKDIVGLRDPEIDGPTIYETPNLDTLVSQGMSFNNAYCSGPKCVVARRSMLTGKFDWRPEAVPDNKWYMDHNTNAVGGGIFAGGISINPATVGQTIPDNMTFAETAKTVGYRTCYIGKYHLGDPSDQPPRGPAAQGFDVSIAAGEFGAPVDNPVNGLAYFPNPNTLYFQDLPDLGPAANAQEYLGDRLAAEAVGFIGDCVTNYSSSPFFLTLATYLVHTPAEAKTNDIAYFTAKKAAMAAELATHPMATNPLPRDISSAVRMIQDNRVYAAMMKNYDDGLGAIRAILAATDDPRNPGKKLSETTILVVSSDHGGKSTYAYGSGTLPVKSLENDLVDTVNPGTVSNPYSSYPTANYPYRLGKTWVYEGGLKIPLLVYYPGVTEPGSRTDAFAHGADLFATFADMAGAAQQPTSATDSVSVMLPATQPARTARKNSFHFFTNADTGTGNLAIGAYREGDYKLLYFMVQRRVELYNIVADPYEQNDLAPSRPDLAAEMLKWLYRQVLSTGFKMTKPGSNSWTQEQDVLMDNKVITALPAVPTAAPSGLTVTQFSPTSIRLNWVVNAANATHSVVERRADAEGETAYKEIAFLPAGANTYDDVNLITNGLYRYRIQSENLGGWAAAPSAQISHTLTNGALNAAVTANVDTVTTLPDEARLFDPLINDGGEGQLTITSITQPTAGTATFDAERIAYQTPASFTGNVTMTYVMTDSVGQTATGAVTFILPIYTAQVDLGSWPFNDPPGTLLNATTSSTALAFGGATPFAQTDGTNLVLTSGAGSTNLASDTGLVAGAPITSGRIRVKIRFAYVDFTQSAPDSNNTSGGVALRDTGGTIFGALRIRENSNNLRLEIRANSTNNLLHQFTGLVVSNVIVDSVLDVEAKVFESRMSLDGGLNFTTLPNVNAETAATAVNTIRVVTQQATNTWKGSDVMLIDYLEITREVPAATLYTMWKTAQPWLGLRQQDPWDDPDGDGMPNLFEFAFGLPPSLPDNATPLSMGISNGTGHLRFTPERDTDRIYYAAQFTTNLMAEWTGTPTRVSSPAGQPASLAIPDGPQSYGRVMVAED